MRNGSIEKIRFARVGKAALDLAGAVEEEDSVELYVNPQQITITRKKVIQRVMTNSRWVFQHWGLEPFLISCRGSTGYLLNSAYLSRAFNDPSRFTEAVYASKAYEALRKLKEFYTSPEVQKFSYSTNSFEIAEGVSRILVAMTYRDTVYLGFFSSFQLSEVETSPWNWNYSFEFIAPVGVPLRGRSATAADLAEEARTQMGLELGSKGGFTFRRLQ